MTEDWELRCSFKAHASDVRALATLDNYIISGSRDNCVKIWADSGKKYETVNLMAHHGNYVSAICGVPPSSKFPGGLIVSGGHDNVINVCAPLSKEPSLKLTGHSGPVCCLNLAGKPEQIISSSWDSTAKLWDIASGHCISTYFGHQLTVWCAIYMDRDLIVTASADKLVKVHSISGGCLATLEGHTDCVRGLARLDQDQFLSCANDGTVRKWNAQSGHCLGIFHWHNNFIYSITAQPMDKNIHIAFGGEGHTLGVYNADKNDFYQHRSSKEATLLKLPATTVWAVAFLPNSDLITGSSDGHIRIFTLNQSRKASKEMIEEYKKEFKAKEEAVSTSNPSGLPGKEALNIPGQFDGEIKLIYDNGIAYCYKWEPNTRTWGIIEESASKPVYEGKEYDFVFSVDIADNMQPLKLPYNKSDDPELVAQSFIIKHGLPHGYLERVIAFLKENSGQATAKAPSASVKPGDSSFEIRSYPLEKLVLFENYNTASITKKIDEMMKLTSLNEQDMHDIQASVKALFGFNQGQDTVDITKSINIVTKAISQWPRDNVFPLLDVIRIALLGSNKLYDHVVSDECLSNLMDALNKFKSPDESAINKMFLFRILNNMLSKKKGVDIIFGNKEYFLGELSELVNIKYKGLEISAATFVLNVSHLAVKNEDFVAIKFCSDFINHACDVISDPEATFRLLVAIGTIATLTGSALICEKMLELFKTVSSWKKDDSASGKAAKCAEDILKDFPLSFSSS